MGMIVDYVKEKYNQLLDNYASNPYEFTKKVVFIALCANLSYQANMNGYHRQETPRDRYSRLLERFLEMKKDDDLIPDSTGSIDSTIFNVPENRRKTQEELREWKKDFDQYIDQYYDSLRQEETHKKFIEGIKNT